MDDRLTFEPKPDKLAESIIHLIIGSRSDPNFGETKLVKLLYYADCAAFMRWGAPITGTTYLHYPHGPYPQDWYLTKRTLLAADHIQVKQEDTLGYRRVYRRYRWIANRPVTPEVLSPEDVAILDEQLHRFAAFNAAGIEEYSHRELGWLTTEDGEPIPYELSGLSDAPISNNELESAIMMFADAD